MDEVIHHKSPRLVFSRPSHAILGCPCARGEAPPCSVTHGRPGMGAAVARARRGAARRGSRPADMLACSRGIRPVSGEDRPPAPRRHVLARPVFSGERIRTMRLRHVYGIRGTRVITVEEPAAIQFVPSAGPDSLAGGHDRASEPTDMPLGDPRLLRAPPHRAQPPLLHPPARPHPGADRRGHGRGGVPGHLQLRDRPHRRDQLPRGGPGPRGQRPPRRLEPARPGRALRLCRRPGGELHPAERDQR